MGSRPLPANAKGHSVTGPEQWASQTEATLAAAVAPATGAAAAAGEAGRKEQRLQLNAAVRLLQ